MQGDLRSWGRAACERACLWALVACCVSGVIGCKSGGVTLPEVFVAEQTRPELLGARRAYERAEYAEARRLAEEIVREGHVLDRDEARLIAGLSAHALGDLVAADDLLTPLARHRDDAISGRALAGLGLSAMDAGRFEESADHLGAAAARLEGDEAARASMHTGDALATLGRSTLARARYRLAESIARDEGLRREIRARLGSGGYALQFGAFESRQNAERKRAMVAEKARTIGIREAYLMDLDGAPSLVAVRIDGFPTLAAAEAARRRLALAAIVVGPESDRATP